MHYVTVARLKQILDLCDPDDIVVLSSDSEGNRYRLFNQFEKGVYWEGDRYVKELTPRLIEIGYGEDDLCPSDEGKSAIFLYP